MSKRSPASVMRWSAAGADWVNSMVNRPACGAAGLHCRYSRNDNFALHYLSLMVGGANQAGPLRQPPNAFTPPNGRVMIPNLLRYGSKVQADVSSRP